MSESFLVSVGLLMPFVGTVIGASLVFFLRRSGAERLRAALLGFAAGVMIAASVWSLLIPAIELSRGWQVPALGLLLGVALLLLLDLCAARLSAARVPCEPSRGLGGGSALILAVTLHNLPEGMAVGAVFAGVLEGDAVGMAGALALSLGIAIQNLPEGAIVSMPLLGGSCRRRAFAIGALSGAVEPIGALGMLLFASRLSPALALLLALAAGAMLYAVVEELIPEAQRGGRIGTVGAALGFSLMMVLDVALG